VQVWLDVVSISFKSLSAIIQLDVILMGFYLLSSSSVILFGCGYGLTVMNATPAQSLKRCASPISDIPFQN